MKYLITIENPGKPIRVWTLDSTKPLHITLLSASILDVTNNGGKLTIEPPTPIKQSPQ